MLNDTFSVIFKHRVLAVNVKNAVFPMQKMMMRSSHNQLIVILQVSDSFAKTGCP